MEVAGFKQEAVSLIYLFLMKSSVSYFKGAEGVVLGEFEGFYFGRQEIYLFLPLDCLCTIRFANLSKVIDCCACGV